MPKVKYVIKDYWSEIRIVFCSSQAIWIKTDGEKRLLSCCQSHLLTINFIPYSSFPFSTNPRDFQNRIESSFSLFSS